MLKIIKKCILNFVYRPRRLHSIGINTRIKFPRRLKGNQFISIGNHVNIDSGAWIEGIQSYAGVRFQPSIEIQDNVTIGRNVTITATGLIKIGSGSLFSEGVYVSDHTHDVFDPNISTPLSGRPLIHKGDVVIGNNVFLGFRVCILPGVTLGDNCIVGAQSVVTKSFPPNSVLAGIPAKKIRSLKYEGQ